jgi:hypothetical protein
MKMLMGPQSGEKLGYRRMTERSRHANDNAMPNSEKCMECERALEANTWK